MQDQILRVIKYFAHFSFPPSFEEIYAFFEMPVVKRQLQEDLDYLVKKRFLAKQILYINHQSVTCYTFAERTYFFQVRVQREIIALQKLQKVDRYLRSISWLPQIQFVGLSGSIAMNNTTEDDDIDLFIITSANRIWTARFFALILAKICRVRGEYNVDKVCLNMFFDELDLQIPKHKRNEYIAHEIFQMKVYTNKHAKYEKFLTHNKWAYAFFPNIAQKKAYRLKVKNHKWIGKPMFDLFESFLKKIQLNHLNKRKTKEVILDTQLWLIKEDYEKKIPMKLRSV